MRKLLPLILGAAIPLLIAFAQDPAPPQAAAPDAPKKGGGKRPPRPGVSTPGVKREMSDLGPIVTAAAEADIPLAREVCATAAGELAVGVGLVTGCLRTGPTTKATRLALFGSVARTPVMRRVLMSELARQLTTNYEEVTPTFTPAGGAVSMALQRAGVTVDRDVTARLLAHPDARFAEH